MVLRASTVVLRASTMVLRASTMVLRASTMVLRASTMVLPASTVVLQASTLKVRTPTVVSEGPSSNLGIRRLQLRKSTANSSICVTRWSKRSIAACLAEGVLASSLGRYCQPAALKTSAPQSFNDIRTAFHQAPQKSRAIVFNHGNDWSLIQSIVAKRNPAVLVPLRIREGRIVAALETVLAGHLWKLPVKVMQRRQNDLGRKWQRGNDGPRSQGSIIRSIGNATPFVIVEPHGLSFDATRGRSRPITGRDSPNVFAVSLKTFWISHGVLLLSESRAAAILEIIDSLTSHDFILYAAKVDPHVRKLVNEERASV